MSDEIRWRRPLLGGLAAVLVASLALAATAAVGPLGASASGGASDAGSESRAPGERLRACFEDLGVEVPDRGAPGDRPALSDAQRDALAECRSRAEARIDEFRDCLAAEGVELPSGRSGDRWRDREARRAGWEERRAEWAERRADGRLDRDERRARWEAGRGEWAERREARRAEWAEWREARRAEWSEWRERRDEVRAAVAACREAGRAGAAS